MNIKEKLIKNHSKMSKMNEIEIDKIKIYFLSYLYFSKEEEVNDNKNENVPKIILPYEYNYLIKSKEIEKIELVEKSQDFNKKAYFKYSKNEFQIEFEITNKKLNDFQTKFDEVRKELKDDKKKLKITSTPKMHIYFKFSDIEFIFYQSNFAAIINGNEKPKLYIYLKKFGFECEITRQNYKKEEKKYYFPLFPDIDINNLVDNLKFHDVVLCFKLELKELLNLIFIYESKFKLVKDIIIKKIENNDDYYYEEDLDYDIYNSLDNKNHDIIWHLLCLVSEHFITYYNLILFLNKFQKELNDIIIKDEFLFIILLRDILKEKYTLSKTKIKFFNPESFYQYIKDNLNKKLNDKQKKEYNIIKNIYTANELRNRYFRYNLVVNPLTCEFKIPFLKTGIFLIDKFNSEIKSYDLIYLVFKRFKKKSQNNIIIDNDISNYYLYNLKNKTKDLLNLKYDYLGTTFDDIKNQKFLFINSDKLDIFERKKKIFSIRDENDDTIINEILFNEDIAAYSCLHKSIKKFETDDFDTDMINRGILSSTIKEKIRQACNIHNFNSCYCIIGAFIGNFSVVDKMMYNKKNRILFPRSNRRTQTEKKLYKDRILYILNISKFNSGILDNDSINLLNLLNEESSENIIKSLINNILNLNIENIYNRVPITKLKIFLNIMKIYSNHGEIKGINEFIFNIKKYFLKYQYELISKNILDIPNSAILSGIIDEYNIMKNITDDNYYICVIIDNEKCGGLKYLKGDGIIFKTRKKYYKLNEDDKICKVKFFNLEKYQIKKYQKFMKINKLKNVIIFPKNSDSLFNELNIKDISQQDFFISWNKDIVDNINFLVNDKSCKIKGKRNNTKKNSEDISTEEEIKNKLKIIFPKYLDNSKQISYFHNYSKKIFNGLDKELSDCNKIKKSLIIDYKNLTKNLIDKKDKNLNELELFYLEYIPKCTLVIKNIINKMKELMEMYSIKNIINLLIGNINIEMNTKNYINEIDNINDTLLSTFNNNLAKLINDFKYLQNQNQNKDKYLYKYKEKMLIITTIIYNICNEPQKIEKIICNYNKIIQKLIKHKIKTSEEIFNEENNNIRIKDCFEYDLDKFGVDHYLLFDNNKLINDNIKNDKDINNNDKNSNKNNDCNKEYEYFFEDYKLILINQNEIKKFYIPELLLFKYLIQLNIDYI